MSPLAPTTERIDHIKRREWIARDVLLEKQKLSSVATEWGRSVNAIRESVLVHCRLTNKEMYTRLNSGGGGFAPRLSALRKNAKEFFTETRERGKS